MPRLSRVRFLSIGHPNARFEDVTLDLRDASGRAGDAIVWLRNGGGKSSILNLFFATIRTDRRDFLGGRADSRRRSLEDYVLAGEQACVLTEWELDEDADALSLDAGVRRLTAAVFYENRGDQERTLRRLFFGAVASEQHPETLLDSVPFHATDDQGARTRHTLASFRQLWSRLTEEHPALAGVATDTQREWYEWLDRAGIDPDLFRYQLQMNLREGGADELFRFDDDEAFIDFLIELTADPDHSENVGRTLGEFREQLRRRNLEFRPELELSQGLIERLEPVLRLAEERRGLEQRGAAARRALRRVRRTLSARAQRGASQQQALTERVVTLTERAGTHTAAARAADSELKALRRLHATRRLEAAQADLDAARIAEQGALRDRRMIEAVAWHLDMREKERDARSWRDELAQRQQSGAPTLERLTTLSTRLAGALDVVIAEREAERRAVDERLADHRASALAADEELRTAAELIARCDADLAALDRDERARRAAHEELTAAGALRPDEALGDAAARLETALATIEEQREQAATAQDELRAHHHELVARHHALLADARQLERERDAIDNELTRARRVWDELLADPHLQARLELEAPTREAVHDDAALRLERSAALLRQRALGLRAERAALDRDREALRSTGLLPPDPDVERAIEALGEDSGARAGWRAIAEHAARSGLDARAIALATPELAQGVIVPDTQLDHARQTATALTASDTPLGRPVVVSTQAALEHAAAGGTVTSKGGAGSAGQAGSSGAARVVLPGGRPALYDPAAGRAELDRLDDRADRLERELTEAEREAGALTALGARIRDVLGRYGHAWFESQEAALHAAAAGAQGATEQAATCVAEQAALQERIALAANRARDLDQQARDNARLLDRVRDAAARLSEDDDHDQGHNSAGDARGPAARRVAIIEARDTAEQRRGAAATRRQQLDHHRAIDDELRLHLIDELRALRAERADLRHLDADALTLEPGDLTELRAQVRAAREVHAAQGGDDGAGRYAEEAEREAARARARRDRALPADATVDEVDARAQGYSDAEHARRALVEADEALRTLSARVGELTQRAEGARGALTAAERAWQEAHRPELTTPGAHGMTLPEVAAAVQAAEQTSAAEQAAARAAGDELADARLGLERAQANLDALARELRRVEQVIDARGAADPDEDEPRDGEGGHGASGTDALHADELPADTDVEAFLADAERQLEDLGRQLVATDRQRRQAAQAVRDLAADERFKGAGGELTTRFQRLDDDSIELQADAYRAQLELRAQHLARAIEELDGHRRTLTQLVLQLALEGIRQIELASRVSRLPASVPDFGGERFLEIRTQLPQDPTWRTNTIGALIDEIVEGNTVPGGVALVQQAVRRLGRPFRVRVLNPNPAAIQRRIPVTDTARFSGGEQLTCAILLYCTLANVRATNRGRARQASSVLVLDNPIGRASRRRFLELQRMFAQAMRVQLVYTTAVNDAEALSVMPTIVRLRNERIDRRRGLRLVETDSHEHGEDADQGAGGRIDAVRITDAPEAPPTS